MAGKCAIHPGRKKAETINGKDYCETCVKDIRGAQKDVDRHVDPKDCFIWYANGRDGFASMPGTGCAHWVAHQKGMKTGGTKCAAGYPVRVKDVIKGKKTVETDKVKKGDLWANKKKSHCGIVAAVKEGKDGAEPTITIEHCSSKQGGVKKNDFAKYFKSGGSFYR